MLKELFRHGIVVCISFHSVMALQTSDEKRYIDRLTRIVEDNFTNIHFGVGDLAGEMGVSHATLHRRMKSFTGQSVSQFIRETRLKRAMELLTTMDNVLGI